MLSQLEELDLLVKIVNTNAIPELIEDLILVAAERLNSPEVANLRSITISVCVYADSGLPPGDTKGKTQPVWNECCINALRLLVPEVKLSTAVALKPYFGSDDYFRALQDSPTYYDSDREDYFYY